MSNRIPETVIENIRKSNDIVDIIGEYVQLKKQGRNHFGLCPFHDEKSPSFSVTEEKQIFHCFGCGKGGNVITFLMEIEDFTFYEALRQLASRSGIQLPENTQKKTPSLSEEASTLLSASEWLTKYYHHLLKYAEDGREGLEYFKQRGVNESTIDTFQLGFSPYNTKFTVEFLQEKGFHQQALVKLGLLSRTTEGDLSDPFRGRIIFPIKNHLGKTVAFGGRATGDIKPKYLNSPENELFHKGNILYNFYLAKREIRKQSEVVVFEGYMDVIAAHQAGIRNCIATLGTALTEHQARLLKRYVDTVILSYDGDDAGIEASFQAGQLLKKYGCDVRIARIEKGLDPDQCIRQFGGDYFKESVLAYSQTFTKFYINYKKKDFDLNVESERITYLEEIIKHVAMVESPIEREYYVQDISDEFNLTSEVIHKEVSRHRQSDKTFHFKDKTNKNRYTNKTTSLFMRNKLRPAFHNAERFLLAHMLNNDFIIDKVQNELGVGFNLDEHKVLATHLYAFYEERDTIEVSSFIDKLEDQNQQALVTELINLRVNEEISDEEINDYIKIIQLENTEKAEINSLKAQQRQAVKEKKHEESVKLALKIIEMERQLKQ